MTFCCQQNVCGFISTLTLHIGGEIPYCGEILNKLQHRNFRLLLLSQILNFVWTGKDLQEWSIMLVPNDWLATHDFNSIHFIDITSIGMCNTEFMPNSEGYHYRDRFFLVQMHFHLTKNMMTLNENMLRRLDKACPTTFGCLVRSKCVKLTKSR